MRNPGITVLLAMVVSSLDATGSLPIPCHLPSARPDDVDVDPSRLARAVSVVRHAVQDDEIPGAVVYVARRGHVILHEAFGFRDVERQHPMQPDSLFRMASNSKAVTAAGILLLVDDGRLRLDDPVGAILPAFDNDDWRAVTIRHLLTHTSGSRIKPLFLTPLQESGDGRTSVPDLRREVSRFAAIAPEKPPGSTWSYNNAGYNILAAVIEEITGSYKQHLRTRLYEPLGMQDSCNHESDADHDRMATVMKRQNDGSWKAGWQPGDPPDWPFPRGSGGMVSTAGDYALFCQMLLDAGMASGRRVLSAESVRAMVNPQSAYVEAAETYGLGWKVSQAGGVYSHTGSDGTYVWVDPEDEVIGMVLTQTNSTTRPRDVFRRLVKAACAEHSPSAEQAAAPTDSVRLPPGFYKDLFMSGGKNLTSRKSLPAAESLGLTWEYYAGSDVARQNQLLIGSSADENGVLLFPDGAPRFRMLYVNGGGATAHGKSLTHDGRERLRQFFAAGGSYCGSCAGSFLSGRNVDRRREPRTGYLHIFPFNTLNTGLRRTRVGHAIPEDSPLLRYRSFGDDARVDDIYHNNGNWLRMDRKDEALRDVEVLANYIHPDHRIDGGAAIWSWRRDAASGRIVNIGCHPEASRSGEKLALTEACFLHALAGTGSPQIKAVLEYDTPRRMNRGSADGQPEFARIGDRQLHHFAIDVTPDAPRIRIELTSDSDVDLELFLNNHHPRDPDVVAHSVLGPGAEKTLERSLTPGRWYLSVFCASSVESINDPDAGFYRNVGDRRLLNGASYSVRISRMPEPPQSS